jgi:DDE domain
VLVHHRCRVRLLGRAGYLLNRVRQGKTPWNCTERLRWRGGGIVTLMGTGRNDFAEPGWRDEPVTRPAPRAPLPRRDHRPRCVALPCELLLAERGVIVSYESVRRWCLKFGRSFADKLRRRRPRPGDTWHLDEAFLRINGEQHYLWRAVDQHGVILDILVQNRRNAAAAKRGSVSFRACLARRTATFLGCEPPVQAACRIPSAMAVRRMW